MAFPRNGCVGNAIRLATMPQVSKNTIRRMKSMPTKSYGAKLKLSHTFYFLFSSCILTFLAHNQKL